MATNYKPPLGAQLAVIAETLHRDSAVETARGNVPGQTDELKFGAQDAISTTEIPIWDVASVYSYQAAALPLKVSSPNANDQASGTGARTIKVFGLDENYNEIDETVTLASVTAVTTTQSFLRIFQAQVITAGSGNQNAGIIYIGASTVTSGTPVDKYAAISAGENQTLMCLWTVPAGKTAYLQRTAVSSGATVANIGVTWRLRIREFGGLFRTRDRRSGVRSPVQIKYGAPIVVPEKSDIQLTAIRGGGANVDVTATFEVLIRDN